MIATIPYDVLDLDGLRDDFAAGRVRQVGVVARRLLATLDAVLSSQGMVLASTESGHRNKLSAATARADRAESALADLARDANDAERAAHAGRTALLMALEFYADEDTYCLSHPAHGGYECCGGGDEGPIIEDRGAKARDALRLARGS